MTQAYIYGYTLGYMQKAAAIEPIKVADKDKFKVNKPAATNSGSYASYKQISNTGGPLAVPQHGYTT